jgi:diaminohydroxyphosphoribosylaminopyrimidine deaminase/5-amino-6-(5-phosphoribosylamino)uracil reductase
MGAALALAERGRGLTAPNPNVGCVIVADGFVVGRGSTQPGGRPHAEAMALAQAGAKSRGATCYTTLEPCAHRSARGPACAPSLATAGVARVVIGLVDPDTRTAGGGVAALREAGVEVVEGVRSGDAARAMAGFLTRQRLGRPQVTLKLATSLDGCIALAGGESRWITGPESRAHAHLERARHEAIVVGRGTVEADAPKLDVRLAGMEERSPRRLMLSATPAPQDSGAWQALRSPHDIALLAEVDHLLVEGGARTAAAFLRAELVDRLLLYRAPVLIGGGVPALADLGLASLADAHGRWRLLDRRRLGSDALEVYEAA